MTVTLRVLQLSGEVLLEDSFPADAHVSDVGGRIIEHLRQLHPQQRPKKVRLLHGGKILENNASLASLELPSPPKMAEFQLVRLNDHFFTKHPAGHQDHNITKKPIVMFMGGFPGAGKTAICTRFVEDWFQETGYFNEFLMDHELYSVVLESDDGAMRKLRLVDCRASGHQTSLAASYVRQLHGVLVVFSVDNRESFLAVDDYLRMFRTVGRPELQGFVVASKVDLDPATRVVTAEEARLFCEQSGLAYYEVSSKNNTGIDEMFADIISKLDEVELAPPAPAAQAPRWRACSRQCSIQ